MQIIERDITSIILDTCEMSQCQASFNSDGRITLRHHDPGQDADRIIVFSKSESRAIFELMREIKAHVQDLPF